MPATEAVALPRVCQSAAELIGKTPMIELTRIDSGSGGRVFAKLELFNPGGSVKDRLGVGLIRWAEAQGHIEPGATLVEPTAGNTGIGLAFAAVQLGYRVILCVPAHFSIEKQKLMEALGGEVVRTPSEEGMKGAIARAHEIAGEIPGGYVPQQFACPGNPGIHYETTGPEIWEQMDGRIDAAVIGVGSGGTFSGVARFLKERRPDTLCVAVEPNGSILQGGEPGPHDVEGIGVSFFPEVLARELIDDVIMVHDDDAFAMCGHVARTEGLLIGGSSGANCHAACLVAARLGADARVVTVFPDSAERYVSKGHLERGRPQT